MIYIFKATFLFKWLSYALYIYEKVPFPINCYILNLFYNNFYLYFLKKYNFFYYKNNYKSSL